MYNKINVNNLSVYAISLPFFIIVFEQIYIFEINIFKYIYKLFSYVFFFNSGLHLRDFQLRKKICNHETNILRRSKDENIVKITNYKKYIFFYLNINIYFFTIFYDKTLRLSNVIMFIIMKIDNLISEFFTNRINKYNFYNQYFMM